MMRNSLLFGTSHDFFPVFSYQCSNNNSSNQTEKISRLSHYNKETRSRRRQRRQEKRCFSSLYLFLFVFATIHCNVWPFLLVSADFFSGTAFSASSVAFVADFGQQTFCETRRRRWKTWDVWSSSSFPPYLSTTNNNSTTGNGFHDDKTLSLTSSFPSWYEKSTLANAKLTQQPGRRSGPRRKHRADAKHWEAKRLHNQKRLAVTKNEAISFNKKLSRKLRQDRYSLESVQKADSLLWQRVQSHLSPTTTLFTNSTTARVLLKGEVSDEKTLPFDVVSFNIVMLAWSRQASWYGADQAHNWLQRLWRLSPLVQADSYSYGAVLNAYAKTRSIKGALAAQTLLQQYMDRESYRCLTTDTLHNAVMDAWAGSGHPEAGYRAHALLRQLQSHRAVQPTQISYNTCIKAYANTPGQAAQAQQILEDMKKNVDPSMHPNRVSYTTCIHAWARVIKEAQQQSHPTVVDTASLRAKAVGQIRRLLDEIESRYNETKDESVRPDLYTYTCVLSAQAVHPLELWARMNKFGNPQPHHGQQLPNSAFLNTCIHLLGQALERKGSTDSSASLVLEATTTAQVAETLLRQMQQQQYPSSMQSNDTFSAVDSSITTATKACKVTYSAVIAVWAQCGTIEAAFRAEQLLDELQQLWETTKREEYLPSAKSFCSVLTAWNKVASSDSQKENLRQLHMKNQSFSILDHAIELEQRMHRLYLQTKSSDLEPNAYIFVQLFQLMASSRDPTAAVKAQQLLKQMDGYAKQGYSRVRPNSNIMATFLNTLTKTGVDNIVELATHILEQVEEGYSRGMGHLKPNSFLYSAVLQAYAKSSSRQGANMAEKLLDRTKKLYREGKTYAKPTVLFYNAVIDAYARSNTGLEAAERGEKLLFEMMRKAAAGDRSMQPNTRSFNAAILAWKNARVSDGPQRAEALLRIMNERYEAGDSACRPDLVTFNSLVGAWAKSSEHNAPERARNLLLLMENKTKSGELGLQPDRITYNSCLDAFARRGQAQEATKILERMLNFRNLGYADVQPDHITLMALRMAWTRSEAPDADAQWQRIENLISESSNQQRVR
ncbi:hypothetical protein ACA910_012680 [Epithemia clementina (nom. ined.)]